LRSPDTLFDFAQIGHFIRVRADTLTPTPRTPRHKTLSESVLCRMKGVLKKMYFGASLLVTGDRVFSPGPFPLANMATATGPAGAGARRGALRQSRPRTHLC
jgi:hypothetical protein